MVKGINTCLKIFFIQIKCLFCYLHQVHLVFSATKCLTPLFSPISLPIYLHQFPPSSFIHPPPSSSPCSLSRSCKLQIRNIPPHMQWEVSANRLLTASRVGHHRAAQLGSHLVASGVTLPPFFWGGVQFSRHLMIRLNKGAAQARVRH